MPGEIIDHDNKVVVRILTSEEVNESLAKIEATYPWMESFVNEPRCCSACAWDSVLKQYGDEAAAAFDDYSDLQFLSGRNAWNEQATK